MKPIKTNTDGTLACPHCHNSTSYLHHHRIEVFNRHEDAVGDRIGITAGGEWTMAVDHHTGTNPSARRDGIIIHFDCETCGKKSQLAIAQHKGLTQIGWRDQ